MRFLEGEEEKEALKWTEEAAVEARKGLCLRAKCGTIVVKDGEIVGRGYNAPPQDNPEYRTCSATYELPPNYKYDRTCCMHAEWRAVFDAQGRNPSKLKGSRLYFVRLDGEGEPKRSGKPYCTECSRLALDAGIAEFVLWQEGGFAVFPTDEYNRLSYQNLKD